MDDLFLGHCLAGLTTKLSSVVDLVTQNGHTLLSDFLLIVTAGSEFNLTVDLDSSFIILMVYSTHVKRTFSEIAILLTHSGL